MRSENANNRVTALALGVTRQWSLGASRENDGVSDFLHSKCFVCPHPREISLRHLKRKPFICKLCLTPP
jgi:hypothetical protein